MGKTLREKVEKELQTKDYYKFQDRVYFLSSNGYSVFLPESYYFKRKEELRNCFSDREEKERNRLVLENLSIFAKEIPDREYHPKIEIVYQSNAVTVFKFSDYPPEEDCKDVHGFKELTDLRETDMNPWNTASERNNWVFEYAKKIRDKLGKELGGD